MDPTEDFILWNQILINSLTAQKNYTIYISDCTELLFSILEIGELPIQIKSFTKSFLDSTIPKSINLLLLIPQETEDELATNLEFLSAVFSVCAWAAQNKKSDIYQIIPHILDKENIFYLFDMNIYVNDLWKSVIDLFFDSGNASIIFNLLNNVDLKSLTNVSCILNIISFSSPYKDDCLKEPGEKIIKIFNDFFITLKNSNERKLLNENLFFNTYKSFIALTSTKRWKLDLNSLFEFVLFSLKSEVLQQQIYASTIFCTFLSKLNLNVDYVTQLKLWCEQSNFVHFLVGKDFNENELPYLYTIFKYFSEHKILPSNIIELLWQRILQVHISQREKYILILINVMKFIPNNDLRFFIEKVTINENLYSDEVLIFLSHSMSSLNYLISSQIASLLFRKAQTNEKVKKVLTDSINDRMLLPTRNYIANLCFDLIEKQQIELNKTEQKSENLNEQEIKSENESEQKDEVVNENKFESDSETKNMKELEEGENKSEPKSEVQTPEVDNENNKPEISTQKETKEIPFDDPNFVIAESLLRKIIHSFSTLELPFIYEFESKLVKSLSYNRFVFFNLIAQFNIKMKKAVTPDLLQTFATKLDDPLWNFFRQIFSSLGKEATTDQVFIILPSIIEKYDFHHTTLAFSSFFLNYLILFNQKQNKIVTKSTQFSSHHFLPTQFYFTHPPLIGVDFSYKILTEADDKNVATYITDVLFMFLTNFKNENEFNSFEIIKDSLLPIIVSENSSNELKGRYLNLLYMILTKTETNSQLEDFGYESHSTYKTQKIIVTVQDKSNEMRFLCNETDKMSQLQSRVAKATNQSHGFLKYKGNFVEDNACVTFYGVINNEITFQLLYNDSNHANSDLSKYSSVFLTKEDFQGILLKLLNFEETSEISNKLLDFLPNRLSTISLILNPTKVIELLNNEEEDFKYVKYCIQTLVDQLIIGDYKEIKQQFSEFNFLDKLITFCKTFKKKSDKILYEILRVFYFLFNSSNENCLNDLIAILFNSIINNNEDENIVKSAAFLYNKIVSTFPNTEAIINNLALYENVVMKTSKEIWPLILDTTKMLKIVNPIFEMVIQKIEQINTINYQNFVDLFTTLISLVPSDIVTNNVFDKCISVLLHEKGQTFISLCEVAVSIIDSNNLLNSINPNIIAQLLSRALQCDSSSEQKSSFNLCISLIEKFPSCLENTHQILSKYFEKTQNFWNYSPSQFEKKINSHAGLTNLGATCYMNSVFQQLFNCIQFRDLVFKETVETDDSKNLEENVVWQIFHIFVKMLFGKKDFVETNEFCKYFKGWGKQLINVREQQDAVEFLNLFLDQLPENLQRPFKGTFIHEIIDFNDSICSSNEENFFALSLDIKHFSNIHESFNSFLKYESFTGENQIFSDELGKKIDAKKYTRIKTAPPNLVLHLKRFEYSRSTFNYTKIKSRFEVPLTIDITPLLQDNQNNDVNIYTLTGAVLHEGSANSGHYISLIKDKDQWLKCNDKTVSKFDFNDFMNETYGGEMSSFCAYLLFYSREDTESNVSIQDEYQLLNSSLRNKIEEENSKFLEQQSIFSKNMIYLASHLQSTEIMADYFINVYTHSSNDDCSYIISERLKENIKKNQKAKWFIDHLISNFDSKIYPIYSNCNKREIFSSLNELIESTFSSLTERDVFQLADICVDRFIKCTTWRTFNHLLYIPLRFIKFYKINENEKWRTTITKKIEDFYQQLISEVVLEEVDLSSSFSILQRITPIGIESSLIKPSLNTKILHSQTNYSHYFNFVVVTKQKYQISDIIKYYLSLNSNKFNHIKFIRLIINAISYSDYNASSMLYKSHRSISSENVALMLLYSIRINKPNLKEFLIHHFNECICPILISFNDEISRIAISIILELFDTVKPSVKLTFKERKPSSTTIKWIPKKEKENLNFNPPEKMFLTLKQTFEFIKNEICPNPSKYHLSLNQFSYVLIWFLDITKDYKFEYLEIILELIENLRKNKQNLEFCYDYIISIVSQFPKEVTQKVDNQYLNKIYLNEDEFSFKNSKSILFFKCAINSTNEQFMTFFNKKEAYELLKNLFIQYNISEVNDCIQIIIELDNEKLNDFKFIFSEFKTFHFYKKIHILLKCDIKFSIEDLQSIVIFLLESIQNFYYKLEMTEIVPDLLKQIEKVENFELNENQISEKKFNDFLELLCNRIKLRNDMTIHDNIWSFTSLLITKIPHFHSIFCNFTRQKPKNLLILDYFDYIVLLDKESFESEVTKLLEVISQIKIDNFKPQFNQRLINILKKLDNVEILSNYLTTILTLNDIFRTAEVEEMAKIIIVKIPDEKIEELISLLAFQFDPSHRYFMYTYTPVFNALSMICEMKPNFYDKVVASIPFKMSVWTNWGISERSKAIFLSHEP